MLNKAKGWPGLEPTKDCMVGVKGRKKFTA